MLTLLFTVIIGLGLAYFATQNQLPVTLKLNESIWTSVPLYIIAVGSLLFGIFISSVIHLFNRLSSSLTIQGKNSSLRNLQQEKVKLQERIAELEKENDILQNQPDAKVNSTDHAVEEKDYDRPHPSIFHRIRHSF